MRRGTRTAAANKGLHKVGSLLRSQFRARWKFSSPHQHFAEIPALRKSANCYVPLFGCTVNLKLTQK